MGWKVSNGPDYMEITVYPREKKAAEERIQSGNCQATRIVRSILLKHKATVHKHRGKGISNDTFAEIIVWLENMAVKSPIVGIG